MCLAYVGNIALIESGDFVPGLSREGRAEDARREEESCQEEL
jgi:hypothetical protein